MSVFVIFVSVILSVAVSYVASRHLINKRVDEFKNTIDVIKTDVKRYYDYQSALADNVKKDFEDVKYLLQEIKNEK